VGGLFLSGSHNPMMDVVIASAAKQSSASALALVLRHSQEKIQSRWIASSLRSSQ